jgi:predicted  nucleic acid-binding Zn-ribbon protein
MQAMATDQSKRQAEYEAWQSSLATAEQAAADFQAQLHASNAALIESQAEASKRDEAISQLTGAVAEGTAAGNSNTEALRQCREQLEAATQEATAARSSIIELENSLAAERARIGADRCVLCMRVIQAPV